MDEGEFHGGGATLGAGGRRGDDFIIILDVNAVFASEERALVDAAAELETSNA